MKIDMALSVFETYLSTTNAKYATGDNLTIADMALMSTTLVLEACEIEFEHFPLVTAWYETFKDENPKLWEIVEAGINEINTIFKNPPDVSQMNHPKHPMRKDQCEHFHFEAKEAIAFVYAIALLTNMKNIIK